MDRARRCVRVKTAVPLVLVFVFLWLRTGPSLCRCSSRARSRCRCCAVLFHLRMWWWPSSGCRLRGEFAMSEPVLARLWSATVHS